MKFITSSSLKSTLIFLIIFLGLIQISNAQVYNPVNYNYNGTPTYGFKIKTNLPFLNSSQMPTIIIEGYDYGQGRSIGLLLNWYIYSGIFWNPKMSSFGADTPNIKLSNEYGKVVIFIDELYYYCRFSVRAFAQGMSEDSSWFENWQTVDEPLDGTQTVDVPYENSFKGVVNLPGGIWSEDGNLGIGTTNPEAKLTVKGKIIASEIHVKDVGAIPDYVFKSGYDLMSLNQVEDFVKLNQHLPDVPSEKEFKENGMNVAEMNSLLLKKIEELTLYAIEQNKVIEEIKQATKDQNKKKKNKINVY